MHVTRDMYNRQSICGLNFIKTRKKSSSVYCHPAKQEKLAITCYFLRQILIIKKRKRRNISTMLTLQWF